MTVKLQADERHTASQSHDSVTIVICTKDRPQDVADAVHSIRASGPAGQQADILIVEEASEPTRLGGVRHVHIPVRNYGFGYARNVALRHVQAELIVFIDDDCRAAPGWLEALLEPFGDPSVLGVAGAILVRDCGLIGYAENILGFPGGGLRYVDAAAGQTVPTRQLSTCNCAYRRTALLQAGGFAEDARYGGEDALLAERVSAMGPCVYTPGAAVYHRTRDRLPAVFRWFVRRGRSERVLLAESAGGYVRYLFRSSWTVRALGITTILVLWPRAMWLLPAALVLYYAALLWRYRFARRYPAHRTAWWIVPAVKLTMDLGTEVGRWRSLWDQCS